MRASSLLLHTDDASKATVTGSNSRTFALGSLVDIVAFDGELFHLLGSEVGNVDVALLVARLNQATIRGTIGVCEITPA